MFCNKEASTILIRTKLSNSHTHRSFGELFITIFKVVSVYTVLNYYK